MEGCCKVVIIDEFIVLGVFGGRYVIREEILVVIGLIRGYNFAFFFRVSIEMGFDKCRFVLVKSSFVFLVVVLE